MTEQMSHIFQYTFRFLLYSDNFCNRYICLLLHCTNSLIHLRVVLSSDKTVNWYTCKSFDWFLRDRNTDLDLPFLGNIPFILSLKTSEKLSEVLRGVFWNFHNVLKWQIGLKWVIWVNPLTINVPLIQKPVNWFALQINWLVSIWEGHWSLKS